ncbi:MAG: MFS transporter [Candidatus Woesebacteria bacterium]|nr:MAG: MFS transporter [Candidatus Woesebacteria bacterium]
MLKRNITIAYILAFSKNTWFWLGIWIFYYLRFTDYAGIGIIETILILTMTLAEIPTGAIADLFGKKKTLIIAFTLETVGAFIMATAPNFQMLALSVFVMCVGGAFYSGTIDALIFDTLKESGEEGTYDRKISNTNTLSLIAPAICSILGGFMYKINPTLPFYGNAFGYMIGLIASFFLIEPHIDSIKFSFRNFVSQTGQGLKELFKNLDIKKQTILLLSIGFFVVIASEMLDSFLGFEFGFSAEQLGILWSAVFIISALASQLTPFINRLFKGNLSIIFIGILIVITFLFSPWMGLIMGGLSLVFRSSLEAISGNLASIAINQNTDSKFRATTISTFNMIKNIPYVLSAYFIGSLSDKISAKTTAMYLGILLLGFILAQLIFSRKTLRDRQYKAT